MAGSVDVINPRWLVVPYLSAADMVTTAPVGSMGMSGAELVIHNGTKWVLVDGP